LSRRSSDRLVKLLLWLPFHKSLFCFLPVTEAVHVVIHNPFPFPLERRPVFRVFCLIRPYPVLTALVAPFPLTSTESTRTLPPPPCKLSLPFSPKLGTESGNNKDLQLLLPPQRLARSKDVFPLLRLSEPVGAASLVPLFFRPLSPYRLSSGEFLFSNFEIAFLIRCKGSPLLAGSSAFAFFLARFFQLPVEASDFRSFLFFVDPVGCLAHYSCRPCGTARGGHQRRMVSIYVPLFLQLAILLFDAADSRSVSWTR